MRHRRHQNVDKVNLPTNLTQGTEKVSFFIASNRKEPLTTFRINNLNLNTLKRNQDFTWSFKSRERLNACSAKGVP